MKAFFQDPAKAAELRRELESWRGTPFQRRAAGHARRGASCDCVSFISAVLVNLGAIQPIAWPRYVVRGGGPGMLKLLISTIAAIPSMRLAPPPIQPGDLLICSSGAALHHMAIYAGGQDVWHAVEDYGVTMANVNDSMFARHLVAAFRVYDS